MIEEEGPEVSLLGEKRADSVEAIEGLSNFLPPSLTLQQ